MPVAQKIEGKVRTEDVLITENVDFGSLLLSGKILDGLRKAGFERPSPIQLKAVPLGRCGLDLIVQAKSGTGKTCVFTIVALESIALETFATQVLVLVPTREIALQVWHVITSIGVFLDGLQCHTFIGGMPLPEDKRNLKKCHIAVGTPGRIKQLIEMELLKIESIRLFILDEADKLLEESFQEQINWIYSVLPENKQMLALSATYPEYLAQHLTAYMRNPTFVRLNVSDPTLLGIKQYYMKIPFHPVEYKLFENKIAALLNVLSSVTFHQCLIFSNLQTRAQHLSDILNKKSWPTSCIAGSLDQRERINVMAKLKAFKCRILISTDLTSRGVDAEFVNLVVNLDLPRDHETYLHRIGRSGRFGSSGVAITLVCEGDEEKKLKNLGMKCNTLIDPIPDPLTADLISNQNIRTDCVISDKSKAKSVTTFSDIKEFKGSHTHPDQCFPAQQVKDIAHFNLNDFDVSSNEISTPSVALSQDSILNLCDTGLRQMDPKKDDSDSCHDSIASLVSHMSDLQMTQGRDDDISQKTVLCNLHVTDTANQNSYLTKAQKKDGSAGVRISFKKQQSEIETLTVPFWKKSSHFAKVCVPSLKLVLEEFETFLEREEQLENHNVDLRTVFPGKLNLYNESNTRDITNLLNQKYEHYRFHHKFASPEVPAKSDLTCEKSFLHGTFPNCSGNYSWHYNYAKEDGKQMDLLEHDKLSSHKTGRSHNNSESVANLAETADNHASEFFLETGNKKTFKRHFKCWQNKDNISTSKKPERTVSSNNGDYSSFDGYLETEDSDDSDFDSKDSQTSGFFNLSQRNKSVQTSGAYYYDYYSCLQWLWACQPWYRSYLSWYQNQDPTNRMNVERGRHFMEQQMNYISMMLRGNHLLR